MATLPTFRQARTWVTRPRATRRLGSPHEADLKLAQACLAGQDAAWEQLWQRYQPRLRAAARSLTHDPASAEELADSLLGDLFAGKLRSYQGLGSLEAWLYTLLAQAHINHWRSQRRQVNWDDTLEQSHRLRQQLVQPQTEELPLSGGAQDCLESALASVLAALDLRARLLLSWYFLDRCTLAEIGKLLRVHESTVSRRLEQVLARLRRQMPRELRRRGLTPAATAAALHADPRWLQVDVRRALASPAAGTERGGAHGL